MNGKLRTFRIRSDMSLHGFEPVAPALAPYIA